MNELLTTQSLEGTPLTISATSMPSLDGMGTGAIRSSVFEINNSSSNVNFIAHVWACCSDLLLAEEACGPKGRQFGFSNPKFMTEIGPTNESFDKRKIISLLIHFSWTIISKPKQVSVIDADPCNEVRSRGVSLTNRIRHIMSQPSSRLNAQ